MVFNVNKNVRNQDGVTAVWYVFFCIMMFSLSLFSSYYNTICILLWIFEYLCRFSMYDTVFIQQCVI